MACCHGMADRFIVVGAGIFGVTAALELRARGHAVTLLDPGPIPAPLAASTDISKVVRMEYGPDRAYTALMEEARAGWLRWNERWAADGIGALYHDSGVLMVTRDAMAAGGFEHDSYRMLLARGHRPERMDTVTITRRYPAWSTGRFVDGFYHGKGGYAESGKVVAALARQARADGVAVCEGSRMTALIEEAGRVRGVRTDHEQALFADAVVLATGAWAGTLHPPLSGAIRASGHPVFHLLPADPALFRAERFPTFTADVARTGYYGFPVNAQGVVKVASHALGRPIDPDAPRHLAAGAETRLRRFLRDTFPALADAPVVYTRLCLYADTQDEDFWIARDPERAGLTVAGGGSGHGFKFAPVLGGLIADAATGVHNPALGRFRWRPEVTLAHGTEAARCHHPEVDD